MKQVVEMLEREVEDLTMPPKPSLYPGGEEELDLKLDQTSTSHYDSECANTLNQVLRHLDTRKALEALLGLQLLVQASPQLVSLKDVHRRSDRSIEMVRRMGNVVFNGEESRSRASSSSLHGDSGCRRLRLIADRCSSRGYRCGCAKVDGAQSSLR
ncbi:hypothetical protein S83_011127 [Arachis hypogaea]